MPRNRARKFYMSQHGAVGGNATRDTAAATEIYGSKMTRQGDMCVWDVLPSGSAYYINSDVLALAGSAGAGYGGKTLMLWPARVSARQTIVREHVLRATGRRSGSGLGTPSMPGGSFFVDSTGGWTATTGTAEDRAVVRFDSTRGRICHLARCEGLQIHGNGVANVVGFYGDGLQEGSGLFGCMTQGVRQAVAMPYASTFTDGRNANLQLLDNEFYTSAEVSTTLASSASGGADTVTLTSAASCNVGDDIAIELDAGGWHYATITAVSAPSVTFLPALPAGSPGDATSGNDVKHASPAVEFYSGPGSLVLRNTALAAQTIPLSAGFRLAGVGYKVSAVHSETGKATVQLGGYSLNLPSAVNYSEAIKIDTVTANAGAVTGMSVVDIEDRDITAYGQRQRLAAIEIQNIRSNNCTNLVRDAGGTDEARVGVTLDTSTHGHHLRRYAISERKTGVVPVVETSTPLSFTGTLTGCTTSPTGTVKASLAGDAVTLEIPAISATSNSTAATVTGMPAVLRPAATKTVVGVTQDNGTTAVGLITISSAGVMTLHVGASATFTGSGTKGVGACTVTYCRT